MGKKRIHELAKDLSLSSGDLIQKIVEWNLMHGNLTASSGVEDYLADEIRRRLGRPPAGQAPSAAGAPQVVRRRKKGVAEEETEGQPREAEAETPEPVSAPAPEERPEEAPQPVKIKPRNFEPATIIAPAQPKEDPVQVKVLRQVKVSPPVTPDFMKIPVEKVPAPPAREAAEPPARREEPAPPAPEVAAEPAVAAEAVVEPPAAAPAPAPSRRVTHELGEAARIISPPKPRFESARVVGSKPNWKDAAGQPGGGPRGGAPRGPGAAEPRPGGFTKEPGSLPASRRPGAPGAAPGGRPPRPAETPVPPAPDSDSRRRDKKKKNGGHGEAGEENFSAGKGSRRREVVERTDLYTEGAWERVRGRKNKNAKKPAAKTEITVPRAIKRRIKVDEVITVSELAQRLALKAGDIIKKLMNLGVLASLNQALDFDTATLVASEFGYEVEKASFDEGDVLPVATADSAPRAGRPPVVTIMGHVDHGKTSLLDYIRKTNIQSGEAGGITQHIGAYHVSAGGRKITFLDTPGHEAFTSMRSRGAQVTDLVILIVAADDGVMPQTREAADHARAARVPILVAINKVDKPGADPERIRRQMMEIGLAPEAWGGDTVFVEISAKTGQGVAELLDMILLQADILELKARPDGLARGRIIEARLDKGRGPVATVLVQEGLLKQGDPYVCGVFHGKIRALLDDQGQRVAEAGPAIPVEIQGISGVPQAGDEFIVLEDEKQARQVSQHRLLKQRESELTKTSKLTLENLFDKVKAGAVRGLNLVVKTDVQGSLEAIVDAVMKLSTPEMKINIIHQSTGAVSETDVVLASASNALVICFGVRPPAKVQETADAEQVQIRYYDVIYKLLDDIKEAMAGLLEPVKSEKVLGRAEVRQVFMVSKVGVIAGSYVTDGKIVRGARARLLRDGVVVYDGRIGSLKRLKDDAREVTHGYECGLGLENYNDVKAGDQVEAYQIEETAATVELVDEAVARARAREESAAREAEAEAAREAADE